MKVLITGSKGQLGYQLEKLLISRDIECFGIDKHNCDITKKEAVIKCFTDYMPTIVIHCAAYTKVDSAEKDKEKCYDINVNGTTNVVEACEKIDATMVHISTDYVFDGTKKEPYNENDQQNPINYYGYTKHLSEIEVSCRLQKYYIVRTSRLFSSPGYNIVDNLIKLGKEKSELHVVNDQTNSPTYANDLAIAIIELIEKGEYGIYHITNEGACNFYEFTKAIFTHSNIETALIPVSSKQYNHRAKKPAYTVLSKEKVYQLGLKEMPSWEEALNRYFTKV
jgi:dTDP-4-dehydrorhamnose reductase